MYQTLQNREDYNIQKMGIVGEFAVIEGVCMGVELYTQNILLSGFGLALGLVFIYLTMNNPGDYIDSTTGVFDKQYFDNWIQEKLDKRSEFHLIAVEVFMLKQINKVYGSSVGDQLLIQSDDRILEGFRYEKEVEHFLKAAVDKDLFEVYYQPVYWIKEERYITLEALSRLKHPNMGMIPPDVFIGIAERQGLIAQIGLLQGYYFSRPLPEKELLKLF